MRLSTVAIAVCLPLLPLRALADCAPIAKAMIAAEEVSVRQKIFDGKDALLGESLKLKDAMFLRLGDQDKWRRVAFSAEQRKDKAEKMAKALPLFECSGPRAGTDGAVAVQVFDYSQSNPLNKDAKSRSSIWLDAEGRVRRLVLDDGAYQTFEYGDFEAPVTEPARRAKTK